MRLLFVQRQQTTSPLNLSGSRDGKFIFLGQLVHTQNGDNILKGFIILQDLLYAYEKVKSKCYCQGSVKSRSAAHRQVYDDYLWRMCNAPFLRCWGREFERRNREDPQLGRYPTQQYLDQNKDKENISALVKNAIENVFISTIGQE